MKNLIVILMLGSLAGCSMFHKKEEPKVIEVKKEDAKKVSKKKVSVPSAKK